MNTMIFSELINPNQFLIGPWVMLVVISILLIGYLSVKKYNLVRALSEPGSGAESSSRLLLFLSGLSAIIFSYVFVTFYIYTWLDVATCTRGKCPSFSNLPDFTDLTNVLLALGIGVIPYTINKVTGAFKKKE